MLFTREEIEHAYDSARRMRLRLSALARLAASRAPQSARAGQLVAEAATVLEARAPIIQLAPDGSKPVTLALHGADETSAPRLERLAAQLASEMMSGAHEELSAANIVKR